MTTWVDVLKRECDASSQAAIGRHLKISAATVNQCLKGTYKGDVERIKALVEGAYMGRMVDCPILDAIPLNDCLGHQARPFQATNHVRVQLYRACKSCLYKRGSGSPQVAGRNEQCVDMNHEKEN